MGAEFLKRGRGVWQILVIHKIQLLKFARPTCKMWCRLMQRNNFSTFYGRILSLKVSFYLRASKCSNSFLNFLQLCCFEMIISGKLGQTYTVLINVQFITFFTRLDKHFIFYIARSANFIICMLRYAYCFACLEKHI